MKALKFSEFYKDNFIDEGYELYLIKDLEEKVMYRAFSHSESLPGPNVNKATDPAS